MLKFIAFIILVFAIFYIVKFIFGVMSFVAPFVFLALALAIAVWIAHKAVFK